MNNYSLSLKLNLTCLLLVNVILHFSWQMYSKKISVYLEKQDFWTRSTIYSTVSRMLNDKGIELWLPSVCVVGFHPIPL